MKKYILLLSLFSRSLCAMELESGSNEEMAVDSYCDKMALKDRANYCAEKVRDLIDKDDLQVNVEGRFRGLVGYYYSRQKVLSLIDFPAMCEQANGIDSKIDSVEKECEFFGQRQLVLDKLIEKHSLVYWVVGQLIDAHVQNLKNVTGKNIDDISQKNNFSVSEFLQSFIHKQAVARYCLESKLDGDYQGRFYYRNDMRFIPFDKKEYEIHYTVLSGHQDISREENRLRISSDSKFLRAFHLDGTKMIWDMEKGEQVHALKETKGMWERRYYDRVIMDEHRNYMAINGMEKMHDCSGGIDSILRRIRETKPSHPVIALFKRPTLESTLGLNAFLNSKGDKEALLGLKESQLMKKITGFPGTNLNALIETELVKAQPELQKIVVS